MKNQLPQIKKITFETRNSENRGSKPSDKTKYAKLDKFN